MFTPALLSGTVVHIEESAIEEKPELRAPEYLTQFLSFQKREDLPPVLIFGQLMDSSLEFLITIAAPSGMSLDLDFSIYDDKTISVMVPKSSLLPIATWREKITAEAASQIGWSIKMQAMHTKDIFDEAAEPDELSTIE